MQKNIIKQNGSNKKINGQENIPNPEKAVKPFIFYQRGVFLSILFVKVFFCE